MADTSVLEILDRAYKRLDLIIHCRESLINGVTISDLEDVKNDLGDAKKRMRQLAEDIRKELDR